MHIRNFDKKHANFGINSHFFQKLSPGQSRKRLQSVSTIKTDVKCEFIWNYRIIWVKNMKIIAFHENSKMAAKIANFDPHGPRFYNGNIKIH